MISLLVKASTRLIKKSKFWGTLQEGDKEASSSKVADGVDLNSEDADAAAGACTGGSVNADEEEVLDGEGEEEEQGVEGSGSGGEHGAVAEDGGKDEADGDEETDDADDAPTTNGSTKAA
ncbi:hypothetical protein NMY22_g10620 [Coprinellus aureogranulatus]|nr:hypothetical protein NMY22_g10620 [Coprinellus aureogranulatus]